MLKRSTIIDDAGTSKLLNMKSILEIKINSRGTERDLAKYSEQTTQSKPFLVDIGQMVR